MCCKGINEVVGMCCNDITRWLECVVMILRGGWNVL